MAFGYLVFFVSQFQQHIQKAFDTQSKSTPGTAVEQKIPDSPGTHLCGKYILTWGFSVGTSEAALFFLFVFWILHIKLIPF